MAESKEEQLKKLEAELEAAKKAGNEAEAKRIQRKIAQLKGPTFLDECAG